MANKNNKPPKVEAPVVEAPKKKEEEVKTPAPAEGTKVKIPNVPDSMSQHDKVLYTSVIQHRKDEMLRNGGENAQKYEAFTMIEDAMIIDIALTETVVKRNPAGLIMQVNEKNWDMIKLLGAEMGVTLPAFKDLPKPTKEQLALAGLTAAPGQVVLKLESKNVSKEAQEKKKAEAKLNEEAKSKDYMKDPTKIETDEQLKEALGFQLVNPSITNPIDRLITTAQFLRSYREILAEKSDNPQAELDKVHGCTLADLLQDIITMVPPTFVATGFGKRLCTLAEDANSVVPAFCGFKNCVLDRKTKKYKYSDEDIAAFVRVLIVWYVSAKNAEMSEAIKAKEANIAVLKKDAKANAKGIETENKKIAGLKSAITHFTDMMSIVNNPSFDIADKFIAIYNDNTDKEYLHAKSIYKEIINTYYDGLQISELEFDSLLLNVQQHVGIILNYFNDAIGQREDYNESNLISFEPAEEKPEEGKAVEEESKNA